MLKHQEGVEMKCSLNHEEVKMLKKYGVETEGRDILTVLLIPPYRFSHPSGKQGQEITATMRGTGQTAF